MSEKHAQAETLFRQGVERAKAGRRAEARRLLQQAVSLNPAHEAAWLYLAGIASDADAAREALRRVEALNPRNPHLPRARAWVQRKWPAPPSAPSPPPAAPASPPARRARRFAAGLWGALAAMVVLLATLAALVVAQQATAEGVVRPPAAPPTLSPDRQMAAQREAYRQAEAAGNQPAMIAALEAILSLQPDDAATKAQLAQLYYEQGMVLRDGGNFAEAQTAFRRAAAIAPSPEAARAELRLAELYQTGVRQHQQGEWAAAAGTFEQIYSQNPAYPYLDEILYSTYFNLGLFRAHQGDLQAALQAYRRAAEILPSAPEAAQKAEAVARQLAPPTPTTPPTPTATATPAPSAGPQKRIVVDISDQRTYVYEGDRLVYNFLVSTGEPGRDTAIGEFQILDKIPMAYASTWNLDMPYWLGIYWAGPLENGFHALPTVRHTGYTLWDGYLGQRVSYGCIILSYADAQTLYNWADIGTPVTIRP